MEHLVIEITEQKADSREGTNERGPWKRVTQTAYFHVGKAFPEPTELLLDHTVNQQPWPVGKYLLGKQSFRRGQYGMELTRHLVLVPVNQPPKAA